MRREGYCNVEIDTNNDVLIKKGEMKMLDQVGFLGPNCMAIHNVPVNLIPPGFQKAPLLIYP